MTEHLHSPLPAQQEAIAAGALDADGPKVARAAPGAAAEAERLRSVCAALCVEVLEIDKAMEAIARDAAVADGGGGGGAGAIGPAQHHLLEPAVLKECVAFARSS